MQTDNPTGRDFLDDALATPPQGVEQEPPAPPPVPVAPSQPTGGYAPLIAAKRKEMQAMADKIRTHRDTGVYIYKTAQGEERFDNIAFQEDNATLTVLNRELDDLIRKQDEHQRLVAQRVAAINEVARQVFRREIAKVPQAQHRAIAEHFAEVFRSIPESEWAKPIYANRAHMESAILQLVQTAYGRAAFTNYKGAPPTGLDDDPAPEKPESEDDVDDFTNNVLYALEQRQARSMSVADQRRAQAAREGGNQ